MRHNFGEGIVYDRDTSQPRERFRGRRRFMWPEEEKSTKKLSDSLKKYKFKSFNKIDENTNSKDKDKDNKNEITDEMRKAVNRLRTSDPENVVFKSVQCKGYYITIYGLSLLLLAVML